MHSFRKGPTYPRSAHCDQMDAHFGTTANEISLIDALVDAATCCLRVARRCRCAERGFPATTRSEELPEVRSVSLVSVWSCLLFAFEAAVLLHS